MNYQETLDAAIESSSNVYIRTSQQLIQEGKRPQATYEQLKHQAVEYSAVRLTKVLEGEPDAYKTYTRQNGLRENFSAMGKDAIKNELLKNVVNLACYEIAAKKGTQTLSLDCNTARTTEEMAVVLYNNISNIGVERAYELLENPNVMKSVCTAYADWRRPEKRTAVDWARDNVPVASYLNNELDTYYAKWGDRNKNADTNLLNENDAPSFGGK